MRREIGYRAVARGYTLSLFDTGLLMESPGGSLRLNLPRSAMEPIDPLPSRTNYYFASKPAAWRSNVPNYARVRYRAVFPGVDLLVYGKDQQLEYDWVIVPGANPESIRFSFTGASKIRIEKNGDLVIDTSFGEVRHRKPQIYQDIAGQRRNIAGSFTLSHGGVVSFRLGKYDRLRPLVIDPALVYAAGFGGSGCRVDFPGTHWTYTDFGTSVALDRAGNTYVLGTTYSFNFPQVDAIGGIPSQQNIPGICEFSSLFIAKLSADGTTLLYSTYISTPSAALPGDLTVDANGNVFATGATGSGSFPAFGGPTVTTAGGLDAFVLELDPTGRLKAAQVFGGAGDDAGTSISLGPDGRLYVVGTTRSMNFPVTPGAYSSTLNGDEDIFLLELNPAALVGPRNFSGVILNSTYLGPGTTAVVRADAGGNAYVAANTSSVPWSGTNAPANIQCFGDNCAHVIALKMNPIASQLLYATYFGGNGSDVVGGLAVDSAGSVYVSGSTTSTDLPTTEGTFQPVRNLNPSPQVYNLQTAFVFRLNPDASVAYATYLGGTTSEGAAGITVDAAGDAYIVGTTSSPDFPVLNAIQPALYNETCYSYTPSGSIPSGEYYCASAGFLSVLNPAGSALAWSTFLGSGTAYAVILDQSQNVYVTGSLISPPSPSGTITTVKISPQGSPLQFSTNSITNGFSFHPGLPQPGGLATIFLQGLSVSGTVQPSGFPLPTELAGVSILVDGKSAPLLAVANLAAQDMEQINFQVPFEAKSNLFEVRYNGVSTFAMPQTVGPGIPILSDGSPAIQHASDYSLVSVANPAHKGETIIVYVTGLGSVDPPVPTGMPAAGPSQVPTTCVFSPTLFNLSTFTDAGSVLYAGVTPGFVGLYQMNIQLSQEIPSGNQNVAVDSQGCDWFGPTAPYNYSTSNTVTLPVE